MLIYDSPNNNITTSDKLLTTEKLKLVRDKPYTTATKVFIPLSSYPEGKYWLGVIIDPTNKLNEIRKDNNATYLPVFIKKPLPEKAVEL